jgi:hypothetical protein
MLLDFHRCCARLTVNTPLRRVTIHAASARQVSQLTGVPASPVKREVAQ